MSKEQTIDVKRIKQHMQDYQGFASVYHSLAIKRGIANSRIEKHIRICKNSPSIIERKTLPDIKGTVFCKSCQELIY